MGGAGGCNGFFVTGSFSSCDFRFFEGLLAASVAPIIGSVGPSLEYGGVAVAVVVLGPFSDEEVNISLMRFGLAMMAIEKLSGLSVKTVDASNMRLIERACSSLQQRG